MGADSFRREVVHVGLAGADQVFGPPVQRLEVAGGKIEVLAPIEAQPAHVPLDGFDILVLFLGGVGVVEAQVAAPAELVGDAEVQAHRLGVADVQVTVGLGREARDHGLYPPGLHVAMDDLADEVAAGLGVSGLSFAHSGSLQTMFRRRSLNARHR